MKNNILPVLKMRYNRHIKKVMTIKEYFKDHTVGECIKYTKILNHNLQELSNIAMQIESVIDGKITDHERNYGFELRGE